MTALKILFFALWFATIAARLALLWKLGKLRIAHCYPALCLFLAVSTAETAFRIHAGFTGAAKGYAQAWASTQFVSLALLAAIVVECFILYAKHFRRFLFAGVATAAIITTVALLAWWPTAGIETSPDSPAMVAVTRHFSTVAFGVVSLTAIGFGLFGEIRLQTARIQRVACRSGKYFLRSSAA